MARIGEVGGAGPSQVPPLVTFDFPNAGPGSPPRAGFFIEGRVVALLEARGEGPRLYRILIEGREYEAFSSSRLAPGSLFRSRLAASPGAREVSSPAPSSPLKAPSSANEVLASLGLPADQASRLALAATLAEGLRPEAARLGRLRRAIVGGGGEEGERAVLGAGLEAKGLAAGAETVDALLALAGGEGEGADPGGGESEGEGEGRKGRGAEPAAPEAAGQEGSGDLVAALADLIPLLFTRTSPEAGLLGLFNHAAAGQGPLLVPFAFEVGRFAFRGRFLLHLRNPSGGGLRLVSRFGVSRPGAPGAEARDWAFTLEERGRGSWFLGLRPPARLAGRDWKELEKSLAAAGCRLGVAGPGSEPGSAPEVDLDA